MAEPLEDVVAFSFAGTHVDAVRIIDNWHENVSAEHFGTAALISFLRQHRPTPQRDAPRADFLTIPPTVAAEITDRATKLAEAAWAQLDELLARLREEPPAEPVHAEFSDRDRHVVVSTSDGNLTDIAVDRRWLSADPVRVELDLRDALNSYLDAAADTPTARLNAMHREFDELSSILDDFRRLP